MSLMPAFFRRRAASENISSVGAVTGNRIFSAIMRCIILPIYIDLNRVFSDFIDAFDVNGYLKYLRYRAGHARGSLAQVERRRNVA